MTVSVLLEVAGGEGVGGGRTQRRSQESERSERDEVEQLASGHGNDRNFKNSVRGGETRPNEGMESKKNDCARGGWRVGRGRWWEKRTTTETGKVARTRRIKRLPTSLPKLPRWTWFDVTIALFLIPRHPLRLLKPVASGRVASTNPSTTSGHTDGAMP